MWPAAVVSHGGTTGLTLNAGGTDQNVTAVPSGAGNLVVSKPAGNGSALARYSERRHRRDRDAAAKSHRK